MKMHSGFQADEFHRKAKIEYFKSIPCSLKENSVCKNMHTKRLLYSFNGTVLGNTRLTITRYNCEGKKSCTEPWHLYFNGGNPPHHHHAKEALQTTQRVSLFLEYDGDERNLMDIMLLKCSSLRFADPTHQRHQVSWSIVLGGMTMFGNLRMTKKPIMCAQCQRTKWKFFNYPLTSVPLAV